jgi:hypothetical protein
LLDDLYDRIMDQLGASIEGVYDQPLPATRDDGSKWILTDPVIVVSGISDVPTSTIDSRIALRDQRMTCEIQSIDLRQARLLKEALITALNGFRGTEVKVIMFENGGPEIYDFDLIPPRYCLPVDFMLTL